MDTFDYEKTYYRILRSDDPKYSVGLNNAANTNENDCFYSPVCEEDNYGGFHFVDISRILDYSYHWGDMICDVKVNPGQTVYKETEDSEEDIIYRAGEITLSNMRKLTVPVVKELVANGARLHEYLWNNLHSTNVTHLDAHEKEALKDYFNANGIDHY